MSLYRGAGGASDATDDSTVNAVAGYASSAASSASAAASSASTASSNADAAAASAASAASNVSQAASSASNALTSASNASTSAANAASSASAASSSATAANVSAGSAATSAANAATSNSSASTHATNAANSATAAAGSATSAADSASSALAIYGNTAAMEEAVADAVEAAANAQQEAQDASDSAVASAASAAAAYEHEQNAGEWASQAQGSANSAQGFATAAQAARDATLEAYDSFDDRYLGVKTSNPTVDNDGNPLVPGSLYFNSSTNMMMLYAAGNWVAAYTSGGSPSFGSIVVNGSGSFASGSASSPTITNIGSENTGLFFPSAFNLGFSTSGSERMRLNAVGNLGIGTVSPTALLDVNGTLKVTGVSTFSAGTAAAPAITTTGDTNTGIFFPAADTIAFSEGGVEAMRLDANGNMGVGVTPTNVAGTRKLEVGGTTGAALVLNTASGNTAARNWATAANFNVFGDYVFLQSNALGGDPISAGTARMFFSPAGNVGIGTTSPAFRLDVAGSIRGTGGTSALRLDNVSNAGVYARFTRPNKTYILALDINNNGGNDFTLFDETAGASRLTVDTSGNLGIGTTTIGGGANDRQVTVSGSNSAQASFTSNGVVTNSTGANTTLGYTGTTTNHPFIFTTNNAERARIDASGNLLVNTTTSSGRLTVQQASSTVPAAYLRNANSFTGGANSTTPHLHVNSGSDTAGNTTRIAMTVGTGSNVYLDAINVGGAGAGSDLAIYTRPSGGGVTERMRLDSLGNLGIGKTNPATKLDINTEGNSLVGGIRLQNGAAQQHTWYLSTDTTSTFNIGSGAGTWTWANSGGERMRLDSNGTLLLGATSRQANESMRIGLNGVQNSLLIGNSAQNNGAFLGAFNDAAIVGVSRNPTSGTFVNTSNRAADIIMVGSSTDSYIGFGTATAANTAPTERARIDASGNLIQSAPATPPTLATNGTMVFNLTSNTNLRVSVRGSDGVTRTANITLA